jgi:ketosteroid isomerase-like protein
MNSRDAKLIALLFNECINNQDIKGLSRLMSEDHTLIVREGTVVQGKEANRKGWTSFFEMFPDYRNRFDRIESREDLVIIMGHAFWSEEQPYDPVIWTAKVENDRVARWRIYDDTTENRKELGIV